MSEDKTLVLVCGSVENPGICLGCYRCTVSHPRQKESQNHPSMFENQGGRESGPYERKGRRSRKNHREGTVE